MIRLLFLLVALSAAAQPRIPLPVITPLATTNGAAMLMWSYGIPTLNTLSNVSTTTAVASGLFNRYMVQGLVIGSTNIFVAFNDAGMSNMATGVAKPFIYKADIQIYSFLVTIPTPTNGTSEILTSTNLAIWSTIRFITNTGPTYSFVWTNEGTSRFFRAVSP